MNDNDNEAVMEAEQTLRDAYKTVLGEQERERELVVRFIRQTLTAKHNELTKVTCAMVLYPHLDPDINDAPDSMDLRDNDDNSLSVGCLEGIGHWDTIPETIAALIAPGSIIHFHEAYNKKHDTTVTVGCVQGETFFLYGRDRVTIGRHIIGDEWLFWHGNISEMEPEKLAQEAALAEEEIHFVQALVTVKEGGAIIEKRFPSMYKAIAKRINESNEDE